MLRGCLSEATTQSSSLDDLRSSTACGSGNLIGMQMFEALQQRLGRIESDVFALSLSVHNSGAKGYSGALEGRAPGSSGAARGESAAPLAPGKEDWLQKEIVRLDTEFSKNAAKLTAMETSLTELLRRQRGSGKYDLPGQDGAAAVKSAQQAPDTTDSIVAGSPSCSPLAKQVATLESNLASLDNTVSVLRSAVGEVKEDVKGASNINSKIQALSIQEDARREAIISLKDDLASTKQDMATLNSEFRNNLDDVWKAIAAERQERQDRHHGLASKMERGIEQLIQKLDRNQASDNLDPFKGPQTAVSTPVATGPPSCRVGPRAVLATGSGGSHRDPTPSQPRLVTAARPMEGPSLTMNLSTGALGASPNTSMLSAASSPPVPHSFSCAALRLVSEPPVNRTSLGPPSVALRAVSPSPPSAGVRSSPPAATRQTIGSPPAPSSRGMPAVASMAQPSPQPSSRHPVHAGQVQMAAAIITTAPPAVPTPAVQVRGAVGSKTPAAPVATSPPVSAVVPLTVMQNSGHGAASPPAARPLLPSSPGLFVEEARPTSPHRQHRSGSVSSDLTAPPPQHVGSTERSEFLGKIELLRSTNASLQREIANRDMLILRSPHS